MANRPDTRAHSTDAKTRDGAPAAEQGTRETIPQSFFDSFFARHDDPWGFESRWYERRKRELLMAVLPRPTYEATLELGCATGVLTERLAERSGRVLALDFAQAAIDAAVDRIGDRDDVEVRRATLPAEWPEGDYDLVVFSEIGYYWSQADLEAGIARMLESLRDGGHLVACHWRRQSGSVTGDTVHAALRARPELESFVLHQEEDFVLEVFAHGPALSVARETGLVS